MTLGSAIVVFPPGTLGQRGIHPVTSRLMGIIIADYSVVIGPDTPDTLADAPTIGAVLPEAPRHRRHHTPQPAPSSRARHNRTQTAIKGADECEHILDACIARLIP